MFIFMSKDQGLKKITYNYYMQLLHATITCNYYMQLITCNYYIPLLHANITCNYYNYYMR
ncbi:hypothetical protein RhiirA5_355999 [Rhizophagus irregularis]|uniref:Uncharacterized protein n=1 Tax=Rhizophagus irregularis TaxID=588596 RepID=A0A2I1EE43_9GLOM|nr:hypothetical protein RhiirA5_355999 [Rhizophagus irregularis]PKY20382.1 hypothetical protein RhiirB3_408185 [Rhizophagus irregularis]